MIQIESICEKSAVAEATMTIPFELRQKSRFKVMLDDGREAGVFLPRGNLLRGGDCVSTSDGSVIKIIAANEKVSTIYSDNPLRLAKACYHLGNRHVHLEINEKWIRYLHDHVLDEMVHGLGLHAVVEEAPFEPEAGAYSGGGHGHHH